jgi:hypothetical protein
MQLHGKNMLESAILYERKIQHFISYSYLLLNEEDEVHIGG